MIDACISEIFASIQGEGLWIGQRHIFVRFIGCDIACRYCDTPAGASHNQEEGGRRCRAQKNASTFDYELVGNRMTTAALNAFCKRLVIPGPGRPILSLTGGEPLLHLSFLSRWLPSVKKDYSVFLETSGIHFESMKALRGFIDIVSMDFKLPSATGLRAFWDEHKFFLEASRDMSRTVKAVITMDTKEEDVLTAARLIREHDQTIPLVLQPAYHPFQPDPGTLMRFHNGALSILPEVRVIPQAHKILKVP